MSQDEIKKARDGADFAEIVGTFKVKLREKIRKQNRNA